MDKHDLTAAAILRSAPPRDVRLPLMLKALLLPLRIFPIARLGFSRPQATAASRSQVLLYKSCPCAALLFLSAVAGICGLYNATLAVAASMTKIHYLP